MSSVKQKPCSGCGERFTCGAETKAERCWCEDLPHLPLTSIVGTDCFCSRCLNGAIQAFIQSSRSPEEPELDARPALQQVLGVPKIEADPPGLLVEGEDYYLEAGMIVFTASYHRRRGYCCDSGCRHCPYRD